MINSNIPELPNIDGHPQWTGVALSNSGSDFTIHANIYSNIEPDDAMGVPDDDYLVLGAWLEVPDDVNEDTSLLGVLAGGSDLYVRADVGLLRGTAKYEGPAIGIYEERNADSSDDIRIGSFIASANLDVRFDELGTGGAVQGTISDFVADSRSRDEWAVRMYGAFGSSGYIHGNPEISRDGGTTYAITGDWDATFYGNGAMPLEHPTSIAGTFWGDVGSRDRLPAGDAGYLGLTGAFGAQVAESSP